MEGPVLPPVHLARAHQDEGIERRSIERFDELDGGREVRREVLSQPTRARCDAAACKVEDDLRSRGAKGLPDRVGARRIGFDCTNARAVARCELGGGIRTSHERDGGVPFAHERAEEGAPEEAGSAGDDDVAHRVVHSAGKSVLDRDRVEKVIGEKSWFLHATERMAPVLLEGRWESRG